MDSAQARRDRTGGFMRNCVGQGWVRMEKDGGGEIQGLDTGGRMEHEGA